MDLTMDGSGSTADPFVLSADATVSVEDLTDSPDTAPNTGDVMIWDGEKFVWGPPSSGGGGATVQVSDPITGDGSIASPLGLATSGVWGTAPLNVYGTDTTLGAPIYLDANGQVRSQPLGVQVLASGASRPNQYPGRVIIQDGVPWWSDGTTWRPLGPRQEGPLTVEGSRWAAAGIALASGVTSNGSTAYAEFHRYGPMITMYLNGLLWTPRNGGIHSDITNQTLLTLPPSMKGAFGLNGGQVGSVGRLTNFFLNAEGTQLQATAMAPNVTNTSSSQAWPQVQTRIAISWTLDPSLDPEAAFAPIRNNAVSLDRARVLHQQELQAGI